jgi:predicted esterase
MLLAAALLALAPPATSKMTARPELVEGLLFALTATEQASTSTSSGRTVVDSAFRQSPILATAITATHGRELALPDDAVAYIPASAGPHPPLLVLLHGAGRERLTMTQHFEAEADKRGIMLLAPTSRGPTWDAISVAKEAPDPGSALAERLGHRFGRSRDSDRVEAAIANLAKIVPVDRSRTVLAGFSDGATFALAMGMSKAHPFAAVIAWSPGIPIETDGPARGRRVFVSHGRQDPLLSFDTTCAEIVPLLQSEGANVTFLPFDGGHEAGPPIKDAFLDAVFGKVAGSRAMPLPAKLPVCHGPGAEQMQPTIPSGTSMMGPH